VRADCSSYVVTTWKKNRKGKELRNEEETQEANIKEKKNKRKSKPKRDTVNQTQLPNCIVKYKSTTVEFQEEDEMTQRVSSQVPIFGKPLTLIENMSSQLNRVRSVQTFKFFFWEEAQTWFTMVLVTLAHNKLE